MNTKDNALKNLSSDVYEYIGSENIEKIKTLSPLMQKSTINLYKECQKIGIYFEIVSARRSFDEQKELYDTMAPIYGVEKIGIPGMSKHEAGMAIDIKIDKSLSNSIKYNQVADIWKKIGGCWGGDNIDEYWHFAIE